MIVTKVEEVQKPFSHNNFLRESLGGGERLPSFLLRDLNIDPYSAYNWHWDNDKFGVVVIQK